MIALAPVTDETVSIPALGISIRVSGHASDVGLLGIESPIEIIVNRGDLYEPRVTKRILVSADSEHTIRNLLNNITVAIGVTEKLVSLGQTGYAKSVLNQALMEIEFARVEKSATRIDFDQSAPKATALLVEDVDNERELLAGLLRLQGYQTIAVGDGEQCLRYIEKNGCPDFILLDMHLPKMNGAETIARLRQSPVTRDLKIYAISGFSPQSSGIDLKKNHITQWFQKPLNPVLIAQELDRQFSNSRS